MKEYSGVIATIAMVIGGLVGFINWITYLVQALNYGNILGFVLLFIFGEILIPFYSIIPFLIWFVLLFLGGLPFYGLYKLFRT